MKIELLPHQRLTLVRFLCFRKNVTNEVQKMRKNVTESDDKVRKNVTRPKFFRHRE